MDTYGSTALHVFARACVCVRMYVRVHACITHVRVRSNNEAIYSLEARGGTDQLPS